MTDIDAIAEALAPYIEQAVTDAVREAVARAATVVPLDGVLASVSGATGAVKVPKQDDLVPCTLTNRDLVAGDHVVIVFYGRGIAYAHGPIPGPPPPV